MTKLKNYTKELESCISTPLNFWRYYDLKKATVCFEMEIPRYNPERGFSLSYLIRLWYKSSNTVWELLAVSLVSGDLKVDMKKQVIMSLGNICSCICCHVYLEIPD